MIYFFNPDADLALSEPGHNYLPPVPIRRMAQDLALLPVWYAPAGSTVLGCSDADRKHLRWLQEMFPLDVRLEGEPPYQGISPWGWNKTLRRRLLLMGVDEKLLPSVALLERRRESLSRRCTAGILAHFNNLGLKRVGGEAREVVGVSDATNPFLLKSLWSGSGKGLYWCRHGLSPDARDWARRMLKRDGALMQEPIYNKVYDFAMEFLADTSGCVRFVGYSRFLTNQRGAYQGNLLAPDEEIEAWLTQYIPCDTLDTVRRTLEERLTALIAPATPADEPLYVGPLGVDMMLYTPPSGGDSLWLHPCVEVNFRMNMGLVAHTFTRRFLAPDARARFLVESFPTPGALRDNHESHLRQYPLVITEERLLSGYLPLTPVADTTTYRVCVIAERC